MKRIKKNKLAEKAKVSIIVPAYNVKDYISECLESLIGQTYGIENLEILVIDDCSPDDSAKIAAVFAQVQGIDLKIISHEENLGLGGARNTGLSHATGEYVMFLDADDILESIAVECLIKDIELYDVDLVLFDYYPFSADNQEFIKNPSFKLYDKEKYLKRHQFPQYTLLAHAISACCKLFKRSFLIEHEFQFPIDKYYEDVLFHLKVLARSKSIFLSKKTLYWYRQRTAAESKSIMSSGMSKKKVFDQLAVSEGITSISKGHPDLSYMLTWLNIRTSAGHVKAAIQQKDLMSDEERQSVFDGFKLSLADSNPKTTFHSETSVFAKQIVDALLTSETADEAANKVASFKSKSLIKKRLVKYVTPKRSPKLIRVIKKRIKIRAEGKTARVKLQEDVGRFGMLHQSVGEYWLIGERDGEARDCGFALFKYIRQTHPEKKVYYIVEPDSIDFDKVKQYGNYISYRTDEHTKAFFTATHLISTHSRGTIEPWGADTKKCIGSVYPQYLKKKYIMLQHGVNVGNFISHFHKNNIINAGFDLLISGAKPEHDYIKNNFGYSEGATAYTGLSRFDELYKKRVVEENQKIKKILVMPTWRVGIINPTWHTVKTVNDSRFLTSEYYKTWTELLNHKKLDKLLKRNNVELYFYPHPEVQQYIHYFSSHVENVKLASSKEFDLQQLIVECDMLITDYSSVFFDFAYMDKPVIHYQFDQTDFFSRHYKLGYFRFKKDSLGPVAYNQKDLLTELKNIVKGKPSDEVYKMRRKRFFVHHDSSNCERILDSINSL